MIFETEETREYRHHLARWVDERLKPRAEELDHSGEFSFDLFREIGELGYLGTMYSEDAGGSGLQQPYTCFTILCEELARASVGFAAGVCMQGSTATHTLHAWGDEEVKSNYFLPALRGKRLGHLPSPSLMPVLMRLRFEPKPRRPMVGGCSTEPRYSPPMGLLRTSSLWWLQPIRL